MSTTTAVKSLKWPQMSTVQKLTWFGKLIIAVCTFGFVYPHVMDPHLRENYDPLA